MTIKELFNKLQNNFDSGELFGEFTLHKNSIHWTYDLYDNDNDSEGEFECDIDEDFEPDFESESLEEQLNEACNDDLDLIEGYLDELDEYDNWFISDSKIKNTMITFIISAC